MILLKFDIVFGLSLRINHARIITLTSQKSSTRALCQGRSTLNFQKHANWEVAITTLISRILQLISDLSLHYISFFINMYPG